MKKLFPIHSFSWITGNAGGGDNSIIAIMGGRFYFGAELTVPPPPVQNHNNGHTIKPACPTVGKNRDLESNKTKNRITRLLIKPILTTFILLLIFSFTYATQKTAITGYWNTPGTWSPSGVPGSSDDVVIPAGVTLTGDVTTTVNSITFGNGLVSLATLSVNIGIIITVTNAIYQQNASGIATNASISGAGTVNCSLFVMGNGNVPTAAVNYYFTSSIANLNIGGDLTLNSYDPGGGKKMAAIFNFSTGSISIGGAINCIGQKNQGSTFNMATGSNNGTLYFSGPGPFFNLTSSDNSGTVAFAVDVSSISTTVNYNSSANAQTIPFTYPASKASAAAPTTAPLIYTNLNINNTNVSGATLGAAITATNVTGNLIVQSGTLNNGGFAIVGNAKTFEVDNGATFNIGGTTSAFPTGFGTFTLQPTSTVGYIGSGAQAVVTRTYGNLVLGNASLKTISAAITITNNLSIIGTATATLGSSGNSSSKTLDFAGVKQLSGTWSKVGGSAQHTASQFVTGSSFLNVSEGPATKLVFTTSAVTVTAGVASGTITIQRQDATNIPVTADATISVSLTSNSSGVVTFNPVSPVTITTGNSSVSFTYTDTKAGSPTITAHCASITNDGTQQETMNPGAISQLVMNPTTIILATAGTSVNSSFVNITAKDTNGNTCSSGPNAFIGTVTFAGTAGATGTSAAFSAGVLSTFPTLTPTTAGSGLTITATSGSIVGTTTITTVNPGALDHFTLTGYPTSTTAGSNFGSNNVMVKAYDANNNVKTDYIGQVYFTSTDGAVILPNTSSSKYTFVSGDNGSHLFAGTGFTLKTTSSQTITATDGSKPVTSNTITVIPGVLANFLVESSSGGNIATQAAGAPFTIKITARDAYNNTCSSGTNVFAGTVNISSTGTLTAGSGTTATFAAGVLVSHSVTINPGGSSQTITATKTGSTESGTSNPFDVNNPSPTVTSISPTTKCAGDGVFTLTVNGTNLNSSSVVKIAGTSRSTSYINSGQLTAAILATDIASAGTKTITVFNPTPGGGTSGSASLTVTSTGTWLGKTSSDWTDANNWCGGVPDPTIDVVIPNSASYMPVLLPGKTGNCKSLTFSGSAGILNFTGGSLTVAGNVDFTVGVISASAASTLFVGGTWIGTGTTFSPGTYLTVNYNGAAQTAASLAYYNLTLSGSGVKTITNIGTVNGNFTLSGDNTTYASTTVTLNIGGDFTVNSGNTIYLINGNPSLSVGGNTIISGTVTSGGAAKTFGGNLTINSTGSWIDSGNVPAYNFAGNLINNGSFSAADGPCTFSGTNKTIGGTSPISITSANITGSYTNTGVLTVVTFISGSGGSLIQDPNSTLNIGGTSAISNLTATTAGNMVNYTGADQTVLTTTYANLTLSGTGTKTISTTTDGTLATGILNIDHTAGGTTTASVTNTNIGVNELQFSNVKQSAGTWGSTASSATNKDDANFTSGISGYLNTTTGIASKLIYTTVPTTGTAGTPFTVTVQSQDANGHPANVTATTTITLSKSTGGGILSGTLTGIISSGTNSVTISTPAYSIADGMTLTATATGGMSLAAVTSGTILFSAGSPTQIAIYSGNNQSAIAGTAVSTPPGVIVKDANNNPVSGVSITFAVASGGGSATGLSATTNGSGIAMVGSWTLGTIAGSNTLTATSGTLTGSPVLFTATATAGSLDHFAISTISSPQTAGTAVTGITLTAQDATNNTVTAFNGTVIFSGTTGITGTSASFTSGQLTGLSVTPSIVGLSQTFIVTASGKTGTGSFRVNPMAPTGSASQIFCTSASPTVANLSATGSNIQWYTAASGGSLLSASTALADGANYYASQTVNSCESTARLDVTATVYPNFNSGAIATTGETICYGGTPANTIGNTTLASGGDNSITYSWRSSADSYTAAISGATSPTYLPPSGLTATTSYQRYAHDGTCNQSATVSTGTWTVTVRLQFTSGAIATTGETICYGGTPAGTIGSSTVASGGDGTITYSWRSSADSYTGAISGAASATYVPPSGLTATTSYRRYAHDGTCNTTATISTGTWIVTVRPQFTSGTIASTGETICYNGNPAQIGSSTAASGGDGTITYQWESSIDGFATSGSVISGATLATYDPPPGLITTTSYRRYAHDGTCNITFVLSTGTWVVTVVDPVAPTGPPTQTYCSAEGKTISDLTTTLTSGTNIKWYSASTNGTQYLITAFLTTGSYFASQTNSDGCESTNRKEVAVTIHANPDLTGLATTASDVCQTAQSVVTLSATSLPNGTYTVNYTLTGDNAQSATDVSMSVTGGSNSGTFMTPDLTVAGTTAVTINSLTLNSCPTTATSGNTHDIVITATGTWLGTTSTTWNTDSNWCGGVPTSSTDVVIPSGGNQPVIIAAAFCNSITIENGATVTVSGSNSLTVSANFVNNGTFTPNTGTVIFDGTTTISGSGANTFNNITITGTLTGPTSATMNITGNWSNNGTFTHNSGTVAFTGTGAQTTGGGSTSPFNNLTINKLSGDFLLAADQAVNGALTLTSGIIDGITNSKTLTIGFSGSASAGSSGSYVKGELSRIFGATGSKNFPVGNGNFHPMTLTYTQLTGTSTVTVLESEDGITIPQNILATQITNAITPIPRHWTVSQSGGSGFRYTVNLDGTGITRAHPVIMILANHSTVDLSDVTTPDYTSAKEFNSFSDLGLGEIAIKTSIVDDSWNTDATWLPTGVPVATDDVFVNNAVAIGDSPAAVCHDLTINTSKSLTIGAGRALTVSGVLTNSAGNSGLVMSSDTTGTASLIHNTADVPATVNRYISGANENWHFLASPVTEQTIGSGWLPSGTYGNGTGYDLYVWNEPTSCWIYKLNTTSTVNWNTVHPQNYFIPGRGYLYSVQAANPTKAFTGNLNNEAISYSLAYASDTSGLKGFNLVGNPYPSSIDWQATSGWSRSGLAASGSGYDMWIWNQSANNYGVCNSYGGAGTNAITRYIAPMQGFFVRAAGAGDLGFSNAIRVNEGASSWKSSSLNSDVISAVVQSGRDGTFDEVRLLFGYRAGVVGAAKLFSPVATAPSLYLTAGNSNYTVRYLSDTIAYPTVPVNFKAGSNGAYTLSFTFDSGTFKNIFLEDQQAKVILDLKSEPLYRFNASVGDQAGRFVLHFVPVKPQAGSELPARIYTDGHKIFIDLMKVVGETRVSVYDVLGRKALDQNLTGEALHTLNYLPGTQLLIIQLQNPQGRLVRKIVCNNTSQ